MASISTTKDSITIVKRFPWRSGELEEYSNTYFFDGTTPADAASWKVLADAVIAAEKSIIESHQTIGLAYGHVAGSSVAVFTHDYWTLGTEVAGTYNIGTHSDVQQAGDTAMWIRWSTAATTSLGKPIYLRNYYHPAIVHGTDTDVVSANWISAAATYGAAWLTGFADGGSVVHKRFGPHGASGQTPVVMSPFVTTRTLERRGRRRPPA